MFLLLAALAAADPLMAVLELQNRLPAGEVDRGYFSDRIRRAALRARPGLRVMTRENMDVLARSAGVDLSQCDESCEIDTGRKLGADLLVSGEISRLGESYRITLRMHDTSEGRLMSVGQAGGATIEALEKDLDQATSELFAPLGQAAVAEARPPLLLWMWTRDLGQIWGGYGKGTESTLQGTLTAGLRFLGAEARYESTSVSGGARETGFAAGISPLSVGTDRGGPQSLSVTFLEPFVLYRWGTREGTPEYGYKGYEVGTRAFVAGRISSAMSLRAGVEIALVSASYSVVGVDLSGDRSWFSGAAFVGLGYGSP